MPEYGECGPLIAGIKSISTLISEYNLRNENMLSLHREIVNPRPCIEKFKRIHVEFRGCIQQTAKIANIDGEDYNLNAGFFCVDT